VASAYGLLYSKGRARRRNRLRSFPLFLSCIGLASAAAPAYSPRFQFGFPSTTLGTAAVAVDPNGNTYLAGTVDGNEFTATPGAFQPNYPGGTCFGSGGGGSIGPPVPIPCHSTFVAKLAPGGNILFATYLGGSASATPSAIVFDAQANIYIAGGVAGDFPLTPGAAFTTPPQGVIGSYIAKLSADGTQLLFSTYIPASIEAIAVDSAGNTYFTGADSFEIVFPTTPGAFQATAPNSSQDSPNAKDNLGSALIR